MAVLYGVSVGPGDYELLTLKAVRILSETDIIAVPRTKSENTMALSIIKKVIDLSDKEILWIDFPMTKDKAVCAENYKKIGKGLESILDTGRDIAFITIGDVSIFSTFSYIARYCSDDGYDVRLIPGVPSFLAVSAQLNKPLALGKESFIVMSGNSDNFEELLKTDTNKVIMKSKDCIDRLKRELDGKAVSGIENCGLETERIYHSLEEAEECGYFTTLICRGDT